MLDPRFQDVEAQYRRLRAESDAGRLAKDAYESAIRGLMIEHEGRYWAIAPNSGRWFASEGQSWVRATPPGMDEPPEGLPEDAPPPHAPGPVAQPQPVAPRPVVAAPARGPNQGLLRVGLGLVVVGVGSFLLPLLGMQFRLISLFGGSPVVGLVLAGLGVALIVAAYAAGGSAPVQPAPRPPAPGGGAAPPGGTTVIYQQRPGGNGCGGCLIVIVIVIGVIIVLAYIAWLFIAPKLQAELNTLQAAAQSEAAAQQQRTTSDSQGPRFANGLPPCPEGYSPPRGANGLPEPPSSCDPALPPLSDQVSDQPQAPPLGEGRSN